MPDGESRTKARQYSGSRCFLQMTRARTARTGWAHWGLDPVADPDRPVNPQGLVPPATADTGQKLLLFFNTDHHRLIRPFFGDQEVARGHQEQIAEADRGFREHPGDLQARAAEGRRDRLFDLGRFLVLR